MGSDTNSSAIAISLNMTTERQRELMEDLWGNVEMGAIEYWSRCEGNGNVATIIEWDEDAGMDGAARMDFTWDNILPALQKLSLGQVQVNDLVRIGIIQAIIGIDAFDIEMADVVIQVAMLGEIVYG